MCILVWSKDLIRQRKNLKRHLYQFKNIPGIEIPDLEYFHTICFVKFKSENHFNLFVLSGGLPDWMSWEYQELKT